MILMVQRHWKNSLLKEHLLTPAQTIFFASLFLSFFISNLSFVADQSELSIVNNAY